MNIWDGLMSLGKLGLFVPHLSIYSPDMGHNGEYIYADYNVRFLSEKDDTIWGRIGVVSASYTLIVHDGGIDLGTCLIPLPDMRYDSSANKIIEAMNSEFHKKLDEEFKRQDSVIEGYDTYDWVFRDESIAALTKHILTCEKILESGCSLDI